MKRQRDSSDNYNFKNKRSNSDNNVINLNVWKELDKKVNNNEQWISATKTKNYLIKDPVLDWIEKYYLKYGFGDKNITKTALNKDKKTIINEKKILENTLFKKGNDFEELIYQEIENIIGKNNCVKVINNYTECCIEKMQDTINYMQKGYPVIEQAVLYNEDNKTFGIADLLIRSDYINELFSDEIEHIDKEFEFTGCKFSKNYHYRVIDIKWTQLQLCSDGFKVLNTDRFPAYKGQLAIYNLALGKIQNYIPDVAYIIGKSYKFDFQSITYHGNSSFERMGHILFDDFDNKYIELTKNAIDWYRDMLANGHKWNIITDQRVELCPNMCNSMDAPYTSIKLDLAKKRHELTSIWRVGVKHREIAFSNNIYNWMDQNCKSEKMGIGKNLSNTIDNIIKINQNNELIYSPDKLQHNLFEWREENKYMDFFIDFETINDVFYKDNVSINNNYNNNYIFMIGVGFYDNNKNWIFKEFHMNNICNNEEIRIMNEFKDYINSKFEEHKKMSNSKIRFFHWSQAETNFLENFNNKHNLIISGFLSNIEFADLYKIFTNGSICINGSLTYKLKDISKSLYKHGLINSTWDDTNISNGMNAMIDGCNYYKFIDNNICNDNIKNSFNNIIKYNEIDCKVIGEILNWLRTCL